MNDMISNIDPLAISSNENPNTLPVNNPADLAGPIPSADVPAIPIPAFKTHVAGKREAAATQELEEITLQYLSSVEGRLNLIRSNGETVGYEIAAKMKELGDGNFGIVAPDGSAIIRSVEAGTIAVKDRDGSIRVFLSQPEFLPVYSVSIFTPAGHKSSWDLPEDVEPEEDEHCTSMLPRLVRKMSGGFSFFQLPDGSHLLIRKGRNPGFSFTTRSGLFVRTFENSRTVQFCKDKFPIGR